MARLRGGQLQDIFDELGETVGVLLEDLREFGGACPGISSAPSTRASEYPLIAVIGVIGSSCETLADEVALALLALEQGRRFDRDACRLGSRPRRR